jgi:hypothetical protein
VAKVKYAEGDWFAVPLKGGRYAVGIIARSQPGRRGVLFGYFFGPEREVPPTVSDLEDLKPSQAVLVRRFGDLKIRDGVWPIIGRRDDWERDAWPMPAFVRHPELGPAAIRVEYDDRDPGRAIAETVTSESDVAGLPRDGLLGAAAVETLLNRMVG